MSRAPLLVLLALVFAAGCQTPAPAPEGKTEEAPKVAGEVTKGEEPVSENPAPDPAPQRERVAVQAAEPPVEVPDRLYFRIGEVSSITGVPPYVLRYWETEFLILQPRKSGGGQRLYRKRDDRLR